VKDVWQITMATHWHCQKDSAKPVVAIRRAQCPVVDQVRSRSNATSERACVAANRMLSADNVTSVLMVFGISTVVQDANDAVAIPWAP